MGTTVAALLCAAVVARADDGSAPDATADPDGGASPEAGADGGGTGTGTVSRVVVFQFTPTDRAQIAIWIEKSDGTFLKNVALTQAVSWRGIGNRPGATQMNSGYHWPYGRREGVLPIWAHRRAAAPDVPGQFPRVIFQNRSSEGYASRTCEDSTPDSYYCLSFNASNSGQQQLDAVSCASAFNSDKGRILTPADVAAGYKEPDQIGGVNGYRVLDIVSLYPPRRDFTPCDLNGIPSPCMGGSNPCQDNPTAATYADAARVAMPDIDAVTTATPPGDQEQAVMFSIPDDWPEGSYVGWLEVNTEGDHNATFSTSAFPTPMGSGADWDSWAETYGYPYRGQPSVIFSVPFVLGASQKFSTSEPVGYGSVDGLEPDASQMHAMDGSITDDPVNSAGSGADRLRMPPGASTRLTVEVRDQDFCGRHNPPGIPTEITAAPVADVKHSQQWAHLHFVTPATELPIASYEVRISTNQILEGDAKSFIMGLPAAAATIEAQALMVPTGGAPGSPVDVDFGGLSPSTHYWVGVRAVDGCNRDGPPAAADFTTTRTNFTQLQGGCFVATAAWGSALAPEVAALRRVRDGLLPKSGLFVAASNLYYRSGPAAAALLARSDTARALARQLIGPVGTIAVAETPR
jgi:hypothetical protein